MAFQVNQAGRVMSGVLDYDRGSFRLDYTNARNGPSMHFIEVHDHGQPLLVWAYDARRRVAYPSLGSSTAGLYAAAARMGVSEARVKYRVPKNYPIRPGVASPSPTTGYYAPALVHEPFMRLIREETFRGRLCKYYEGRIEPRKDVETRVTKTTIETSPLQTFKVWMDKDTGVILRWIDRLEFGGAVPMPPQETRFEVTRFTPSRSLPRKVFQLPTGTEAHVPELFADVKLPKGVKVVRMTGAFAGTGIDMTQMGR